jgi:hypothetical protein
MFLVRILLPLHDAAGDPFPAGHYGAVRDELTARFGGMTAHSRAPAEGLWDDPADRRQLGSEPRDEASFRRTRLTSLGASPMHHRILAGGVLFAVVLTDVAAAQMRNPLKHVPQPTSAAITAGDLITRLYIFSDDSMMGRAAGTIYNNKGTDYIAGELKRLGIKPAGDSGTYFQQIPLVTLNVSTTRPLTVGDQKFYGMKDFIPRVPHGFSGEQIVYGGTFGDTNTISPVAASGKVVLLTTPLDANGKPTWNNMRVPVLSRYARNANGVWIVGMSGMSPADMQPLRESGITFINDPANPENMNAPYGFGYVTNEMAEAMMGAPLAGMKPGTLGRTLNGFASFDSVVAPARNVVAVIPGSDPKLRGEYVALGGHNDHIGFQQGAVDHDSVRAFNMVARPEGAEENPERLTPEMTTAFHRILDSLHTDHPARRDSIYNGADDDGSGSMALLEIAEYFAKTPAKPKRSLLFVWHTGEELGLLGSEYFTDHPTVPRDSIVTQLNMDMIGRGDASDVTGHVMATSPGGQPTEGPAIHGNPNYLQLVGSRRLSTQLGDLIEAVNKSEARPLDLDYSIDADRHPANIYCRSDLYMYARYGIPITFFTTGGHADYHQLTDEPEYIDYDHYARVTNFVKDVAIAVADLDHRPVVDKPKPDPHGQCRQ